MHEPLSMTLKLSPHAFSTRIAPRTALDGFCSHHDSNSPGTMRHWTRLTSTSNTNHCNQDSSLLDSQQAVCEVLIPLASGSLISFVSGGELIPGPNSRGVIGGLASVIGQAARGEKQGSEWDRCAAENAQRQQGPRREKKGIVSTPIRTYKELLAKNVLYLMVVNMPSEEEMAAARAAVMV
ncbi:uncharacterized protein M437DRAFT_66735 [Aureobasidium melanogenum CBS 110374]|uniref:Uncharacterized protein n=1 Tax=Aureobasidium melanogenum (strain CBS 110374) TaxID=1043003 RepID=A0A074VX70_AURM1|nr:uncharacterized protein M437DRAFT_66735 [Aureobasidium melanogenum CBS 110374]KEQ62317.1 hypothetical protein M437DRAFT_66735 [Aureobasidium melanogenum CBS 110374]